MAIYIHSCMNPFLHHHWEIYEHHSFQTSVKKKVYKMENTLAPPCLLDFVQSHSANSVRSTRIASKHSFIHVVADPFAIQPFDSQHLQKTPPHSGMPHKISQWALVLLVAVRHLRFSILCLGAQVNSREKCVICCWGHAFLLGYATL